MFTVKLTDEELNRLMRLVNEDDGDRVVSDLFKKLCEAR
jgi:hypothetical protein